MFSPALTSFNDTPNSHVAYFDSSLPGAQPVFQSETLIPAIRAALALNCTIQPSSRFDRKHYFHWDQPSGYQITQYYEPFAKNGHIILYARDGIAPEDGDQIRIDIQQVQMEQDTAKTVAQPGGVHWLDFNRVGAPLIEIITEPQIHHPATAAALVRKIQLVLGAVDACTAGMEEGGLRADVNVSVRPVDMVAFGKLGTRTEIKNLNSFRAVEDAVIAERNRQIRELELGNSHMITSETRGWTPSSSAHGSGQTHRLRGKEGEVDYRYIPDPDLGPVLIDDKLVEFLRLTSGTLPDAELNDLVDYYGLSEKDARALMLLDGGGRVQYFYDVVDAFERRLPLGGDALGNNIAHRPFIANWLLHQLGRLTSERNNAYEVAAMINDLEMTPEGRCRLAVNTLADVLVYRYEGRITANVAKDLLFAAFRGDIGGDVPSCGSGQHYADVKEAIDQGSLWFDEISVEEYRKIAERALEGEEKTLKLFVEPKRYPYGKLQYLVGKLLQLGPEGRMDPLHAEKALKSAVEDYVTKRF
ncbi:glutamyl-tRNA b subunit [Grosmannia clavigera kw1407]|uniref:Glutamyl-tRNA b subunit n=1 Tax=Grosmannia clavigera (strain kw1407 / UAMH 11150) TaxID=655863 RepID=F0XG35_GROCL|nr:glutamyl-tRNA b subunit [Grosmannia clavigera kw1407]EFX03406.1 glutamyl-tRNA b subunit [Grosmannia clavigera kw1407]